MSFADIAVTRRTRKNTFFKRINMIIDWKSVEKRLLKIKIRGMKNAAGNPAYNPIILFKMLILQTWYGLSDESVEDMVNENLSAAMIWWKIESMKIHSDGVLRTCYGR